VIVDGYPELGLLSSASSPQAPETWPLLPSSLVQVQGVMYYVARQEERHRRQSPGVKKSVDQMTLRSWLSQQFFPAASPRPWRKSGAKTHPC